MSRLDPAGIVRAVRELPALPAALLELLDSLSDDGSSAEQLAVKVSHDQSLAARTLRLANSSLYGSSRNVTSIADATAIIGLRTLRYVATAAGLAGHLSAGAGAGLDLRAFWRHSFGTALSAAALARECRLDERTAFTVGLLHDIGRLALASGTPDAHAGVRERRRLHDCPDLEAERSVLGTDHAVIGGLIAERWNFAPVVVEAIAGHHRPADPGSTRPGVADLVHVADNIAHALDLTGLDDDAVPTLCMASWVRLGLDDASYCRVFNEVEAQHGALCSVLLD